MLNRPNVICTPHLGASTAESEENCAVMAVTQLRNYLEYGVVSNSVNFPITEVGFLNGHPVSGKIPQAFNPGILEGRHTLHK